MAGPAEPLPTVAPVLAYDVFNGDADGLCALHQLRLAQPREARRITGVKRDVALLRQVPSVADIDVTVLDISLDTNVDALARLLEAGAIVTYYDHHSARLASPHPRLTMHWDDSPHVCTSVLVDRALGGRYRRWAIVGAFGDNLDATAARLAGAEGVPDHEMATLSTLGRLLNYNAYGDTLDDLHIRPDALYDALHPFADPLEFVAASPCFAQLEHGYWEDLSRVDSLVPHHACEGGAVYVLPDEPWARRISGTFANLLAAQARDRSFAVLNARSDGSCCVSVRSSKPDSHPANLLCERFDTGGGRRAAAGVNVLPSASIDAFIDAFSTYFTTMGAAGAMTPTASK
ncbi:DHH family phosphoesterase [Trinickia sp.]|uniref:DHH family phosphoesterase n=1 Tax=Trinickia sp. TaxID=2571163 RepID=UPI003F7E965E